MDKEREPRPRDDPPPAERDDVRVATSRCPFCREDVSPEGADVCRDCLARHHPACWTESGRCAACRSEQVLRAAETGTRCAAERCEAPGVARANLSDSLYCPEHARAGRRDLVLLGGTFVAAGIGVALWIVGQTLGRNEPLHLGFLGVVAGLVVIGGVVVRVVRGLPPVEASRPRHAPERDLAQGDAPVIGASPCGWTGCIRAGVALGNASRTRFCPEHARATRAMLAAAGRVFMAMGVLTTGGGVWWAALAAQVAPLALSAVGAAILAFGLSLAAIPRRLPPLEDA